MKEPLSFDVNSLIPLFVKVVVLLLVPVATVCLFAAGKRRFCR